MAIYLRLFEQFEEKSKYKLVYLCIHHIYFQHFERNILYTYTNCCFPQNVSIFISL